MVVLQLKKYRHGIFGGQTKHFTSFYSYFCFKKYRQLALLR